MPAGPEWQRLTTTTAVTTRNRWEKISVWIQCAVGNEGIVTDTYSDNIADPNCTTGLLRVVRGGIFWSDAWRCCSAYRYERRPTPFLFGLFGGGPEQVIEGEMFELS